MLFTLVWLVVVAVVVVSLWSLTPEQYEDVQCAKEWLGFKSYSFATIDEYENLRKEKNRTLQERELLEKEAARNDAFWRQNGDRK